MRIRFSAPRNVFRAIAAICQGEIGGRGDNAGGEDLGIVVTFEEGFTETAVAVHGWGDDMPEEVVGVAPGSGPHVGEADCGGVGLFGAGGVAG